MPVLVDPFRFGSPVPLHRYWEVFSIAGRSSAPAFGEWEFAASPGGADMTTPGSGSTTGQIYGYYFTSISNPQNMIDDNLFTSSVATASGYNMNVWGAAWRQDFGAPRAVEEIRLTSRDAGINVTSPWGFFIRGSDDLLDWTTYVVEDNADWPLDGVVTKAWAVGAPFPKSGRADAIAWRVYGTANDGNAQTRIGGIEFAATPGGASISTLPSGDPGAGYGTVGTAFSSGNNAASFTSFCSEKAFDGSATTYWLDNRTGEVFVGMLFPAKQDVREVRLTAPSATPSAMITAGRVEYTTDFNTWHTAATFSGLNGWSASQTRTIAVPA